MFILVIINFYIVGFAIKYLFISLFSHIIFINDYSNQIYLFMISLTIFNLAMFNYAIIISLMFI